MYWYHHLFIGDSVRHRYRRLIHKISNRKIHPVCFLIILNDSGRSLFEIVPSSELLQRNYPDNDLKIIGIAGSKKEAIKLSEKIILQASQMEEDFDIETLMKHREEGKEIPI